MRKQARALDFIAVVAVAASIALACGCEEPRERPADLPPGPYAQSEEIPSRLQQRGIDVSPVYRVESVQNGRVHLLPEEPSPVQERRQGDPVDEFVVAEESFRAKAGVPPHAGQRVELEMNELGAPAAIRVLGEKQDRREP